jgi:(p)ppGpp synthase/HD superfamily hydrolase
MKITFEKQLAYAIEHHGRQTRKRVGDCRLPYIIHPLDLMRQLQAWGIVDEKYKVLWEAAMFHDLVEDTDLTGLQLEQDWGSDVAELVDELTFVGDDRNLEAKAAYIDSFVDKSIGALVLKIADRLCNTADSMTLANGMEKAKTVFKKGQPLWSAYTKRFAEANEYLGTQSAVEVAKGISTYSLAFADEPIASPVDVLPTEPEPVAKSPSE